MELESKEGIVVFLKSNNGSKSECILPYLYSGKNNSIIVLYLQNDNPFENKGFISYDGARVRVTGKTGLNGEFIVSNIEII